MEYLPLEVVKHRLKPGAAVPFNIFRPDHTLLLARGQMLRDEAQTESMIERRALVDSEEIKDIRSRIMSAPVNKLPALWSLSVAKIGTVLQRVQDPGFVEALNESMQPVLALVDRDPDLAIFQIVRPATNEDAGYGIAHSVHAAIGAYLVAQRLGWSKDIAQRAFKAALTMNVGMLELQTRLSLQTMPMNPKQREAVRRHPQLSVELLQTAGIDDAAWLAAIDRHHDPAAATGTGPGGELAALLRCVDIYTAKLSARASRAAMPAHRAGREIFIEGAQSAIAAAVVKEFGIYPPGCFIALQSGELGIVLKRGQSAKTPIIATLRSRSGEALIEPTRRTTEDAEHAVAQVVSESRVGVRLALEKLAVLAAR